LFEFEFLRNKREGIFASFSKLLNKFVSYLIDNKLNDLNDAGTILNSKQHKEKSVSLRKKIKEYLSNYKDF